MEFCEYIRQAVTLNTARIVDAALDEGLAKARLRPGIAPETFALLALARDLALARAVMERFGFENIFETFSGGDYPPALTGKKKDTEERTCETQLSLH